MPVIDTRIIDKAARQIGKCSSCKAGFRREVRIVGAIKTVQAPSGGATSRVNDTKIVSASAPGAGPVAPVVACACGGRIAFKTVTGVVTKKKCSAKCASATKSACECACGGECHGIGLLAV